MVPDPSRRQTRRHEWLRDNGYDDIIRRKSCGRGEDDMASAFKLCVQQLRAEQKQNHPQTLRACKGASENGDDFPMELFGAWVGQRSY